MGTTMTTTTLVTIATVTILLCHSVTNTVIIIVVVLTMMPWDWSVLTLLLKVHMLATQSYIVSACIDYVYNCTGTSQECSDGDIQLVNGGKENRGRVEYCYNAQWSPMCSLSVTTARLICKSLGYDKYQC